ncbi:unnamed protein product [Linum tenue]|uniref:Trehalase n=1 Tax=Linum tenue TaxID=586396 RepID=A0AAV0JFY2_9ROSI|nr:unnamed protein product [Linum tenue]
MEEPTHKHSPPSTGDNDVVDATVVPTTPLLAFLERLQETALQTLGKKGFDAKYYIDVSLKSDLSSAQKAFDELPKRSRPNGSVAVPVEDFEKFVTEYLEPAGSDLVAHEPVDFVAEPDGFLPKVENPEVRAWALEVHSLWKILIRKVSDGVGEHPERHTLLPLPEPMLIPGSRFLEVYYWDSYWAIRGLMVSKMYETAKSIVTNLIYLLDTYGHVLNGARAYYTNRSEPPLLSAMVSEIYNRTGDLEFARKSLPALIKEHKFWTTGKHIVTVHDAQGAKYSLSRYFAMWNKPRPESGTIDKKAAAKISDNGPGKQLFYREVASTAESGWDFSTRWMRDISDYTTLSTTSILPVDLNTYLLKLELDIALLANVTGEETVAKSFSEASQIRKKAIESVFWNAEKGQWFDYWLNDDGSSSKECQPHICQIANQNQNAFASNYAPLWIDLFHSDTALAEQVTASLESSGLVLAAGIATSLTNSGQQWDFPNGWPPLQHQIVEGLVRSGSEKAKELAEEIAVRWINSNYAVYKKTGAMHEKLDVRACGEFGGGGELVLDGQMELCWLSWRSSVGLVTGRSAVDSSVSAFPVMIGLLGVVILALRAGEAKKDWRTRKKVAVVWADRQIRLSVVLSSDFPGGVAVDGSGLFFKAAEWIMMARFVYTKVAGAMTFFMPGLLMEFDYRIAAADEVSLVALGPIGPGLFLCSLFCRPASTLIFTITMANHHLHFLFLLLLPSLFWLPISAAESSSSCGGHQGPVVPITPLLSFLVRVQETALQTLGGRNFDPKFYVDVSLRFNLSHTQKVFDDLPRRRDGSVSVQEFQRFVAGYLESAGNGLVLHQPVDFVAEPEGFLPKVKNAKVRAWALEVHSLWRNLSRKVSDEVRESPDLHTLLPLPEPVVIPGSRFREVYYWDSYWVIRGLLASKMYDTAKSIVTNLIYLLDTYGHVLNGARSYYTNRSQPPLLSAMVYEIYNRTGDVKFARKALPALIKEHEFWTSGEHKITVQDGQAAKHSLSRYYAKWNKPRPESATIDRDSAANISDSCEKQDFYREVASTAESGWDFSTRWMRNTSDFTTLSTTSILPVDLNTYLLKLELDIAFLAKATANRTVARRFTKASEARIQAIKSVFWNAKKGQWFDYWLNHGSAHKTQKGNHQNQNAFASNFVPLWIDQFHSGQQSFGGACPEKLQKLRPYSCYWNRHFPNKLRTTMVTRDFPNGWAPLQHVVVEGLARSGSSKAKALAEEIAVRWINSNYIVYNNTGAMHEKLDVEACGEFGGGGEYVPQTGFGWTNGVVLAFLEEFGWPQDRKLGC